MLIHLETCVRYILKPRACEETNPDEQSVNSVSLWRWRGHILRDSHTRLRTARAHKGVIAAFRRPCSFILLGLG